MTRKDKLPSNDELIHLERLYHMHLELPEKWSENETQKTINVTVDRKTATLISSRIYEDVARSLVALKLEAQYSKHSVELQILLEALKKGIENLPPNLGSDAVTAAITVTLTLLLKDIKKIAVSYWRKKIKSEKKKNFSFYG